MKLPIKVGDKTFYMDSEEWEKEKKWRKDAEKHFHQRSGKDSQGNNI